MSGLGLGLSLGLGAHRKVGAKLDPGEALAAWITKVESLPGGTVGETDAVAALITTLMANGIWQKLDYLTIANASAPASLVNLVNPEIVSTVVNAMVFVEYLGFSSGNDSSYIDTNVNLTTTKNYTGGTGTMGVYFGEKVTTTSSVAFIGSIRSSVANRNSLSQSSANLNPVFAYLYYTSAAGNRIEGASNPDKYLACTNNADADWVLIQDATPTRIVQTNNGFNANALFNGNVYMCALNNGGGISNNFTVGDNNGLIGSGIIGGYLSSNGADPAVVAGQHLILKNALETYYEAVKP